MKPSKIYVDMDGVLTAFDKGVFNIIKKYSMEKRLVDSLSKADQDKLNIIFGMTKEISDIRAVLKDKDFKNVIRTLIHSDPTWWASLDWTDDGKKLWDYLKGYNPTVLTSSLGGTNSSPGKKEWVIKNLGRNVNVIIVDDKEELAAPDALLIDDRHQITDKFEKAGGQVILHTSAQDTIKQLEKMFSVSESLKHIKSFNGFHL